MDQRDKTDQYDIDDPRFPDKEPHFWPRVIGIGILVLAAILLVAYSTFEIGSIAMAFISDKTLRPAELLVIVLVAIAGVFLIP